MAKTIATIGGIALAPGVSKNRRLYTPDHVKNAVARAQKRIESGERPMVMLTSHGAGDNSNEIAAHLTSMSVDEAGRARYTAAIADTPAGRTIASLTDTSDGNPAHLDGVSIRGAWLGTVRKVRGPDGEPVETAGDLELTGLDFTHSPGVDDASIDTFAWAKRSGRSETTERVLITESVQEARVSISEETAPVTEGVPQIAREALAALLPGPVHVFRDGNCASCGPVAEGGDAPGDGSKPYGNVTYADPGYQADKKKRYPLDSKAHAKSAWSYVSQAANAKAYSANQLKRVKGRIMKALKAFGVTLAAEGWTIEPAFQLSESVIEWMGDDPKRAGSWCIRATNGPVTIELSSYCMDPADLDVILAAAAAAASQSLKALDPDMDGDVDVPGTGDGSDTDGDAPGESAPPAPVAETAADPDPASEAGQLEEEEPAMAEPTTATPAAETAPPALDPAAIAEAAVAKYEADRKARKAAKKAKAPKESAKPAAPVTETADERVARLVEERAAARIAAEVAPAVAETEDQRIDRLVEARVTAEKQRLVASGAAPAGRKGLTDPVNEHSAPVPGGATGELNSHGMPASWPDKPLHQYTTEEMDQYCGPATTRHVLGPRADLLG